MITCVNINGLSPSLVWTLILWRSGSEFLMGNFWHSYLPATRPYFRFQTITWININGFSPSLVRTLILWRSGSEFLMGKFRQFLTELSALDTWYFRFWTITWVNLNWFSSNWICALILWRSGLELLWTSPGIWRKQIFSGMFEKICFFLPWKSLLCVLIRIAWSGQFQRIHPTNHLISKIEKPSLNNLHLPSDLELWLTLSGSSYPCLEQISMIPKVFEPLKFDCRLDRLFSRWVWSASVLAPCTHAKCDRRCSDSEKRLSSSVSVSALSGQSLRFFPCELMCRFKSNNSGSCSTSTGSFFWHGFYSYCLIYIQLTLLISKSKGTFRNTSRYLYLDISDLQNWGKINRTTTFHKLICNLTSEVRDILTNSVELDPELYLHCFIVSNKSHYEDTLINSNI